MEPSDGQTIGDYENEDDIFRFFVSTRRLINFSSNLKTTIQTDATYKLVWQGFPILLVGGSDSDRVFHPLGIAVCSREAHFDYKFLFDALQLGRSRLELPPLSLGLSLMADAADSITNGFKESFVGSTGVRGVCWFHVKKAVDKHLNCVKDLNKRQEIISDIVSLQVTQTRLLFDSASKLFLEKWDKSVDPQVTDFIEYFKKEWVIGHPNWFEGYNHPHNVGAPSTNNGNESINGVIKKEDTLRSLLDLNTFLVTCFSIARKWSHARDPLNKNHKIFALEPTISLSQWTLGYNWQRFVAKVKQTDLNANLYYVSSNDGIEIESSLVIDKYEELMASCSWKTFEGFKNCAFGYWCIKINADNWKLSSCTCPIYFKKYICKHIIGIAIRLKLAIPDKAAKNVPLNQKRKAGRPCLAAPALVKHTFTSILSADYDECVDYDDYDVMQDRDTDQIGNPIEIETTSSQTEIPATQNSIENDAELDSIEAIEQLLTVPAAQQSNIIPALATTIEAVAMASKKRGRPPGSKNKPKSPCSVNYLNKKRSPRKKKSKLDL